MRVQRAARRWSQRELAEHLGWNPASVSQAEAGKRGFDVDDLFNLAKVFGIPVAELFRDASEDIRQQLTGPVA